MRILWTIACVLIAFWLLGVVIHLAGMLIHVALIVAILIIAYNLITGRRAI